MNLVRWLRLKFAIRAEESGVNVEPDWIRAHKHSMRNRKEIEASSLCGCFYCLTFLNRRGFQNGWMKKKPPSARIARLIL